MGDADGAVAITSMVMYVRKVKPMPGFMNRVNQMLNTTTAKYPITPSRSQVVHHTNGHAIQDHRQRVRRSVTETSLRGSGRKRGL